MFPTRDNILKTALKLLKQDGLKFSVDELAKKLQISKKTIYKEFKTKEELALGIYQHFFEMSNKEIHNYIEQKRNNKLELLLIYYKAKHITRKEVFNKYALNNSLNLYTIRQCDLLWDELENILILQKEKSNLYKLIIDSVFEKMIELNDENKKEIMEVILKLL